jgi:hypothetical protein
MIIIQEFNSLNEIDPEFHDEIVALIPHEISSFNEWKIRESQAAADQQFYYYLFFSSEKNVPIGLAQAQITVLDPAAFLPFGKRLLHQIFQQQPNWKYIKWSIGSGYYGPLVISPKYYRQAKELLQKKISQMEQRPEVVAQSFVSFADLNPLKSSWNDIHFQTTKKLFYLDCFTPLHHSYEQYLFQLAPDVQQKIKTRFKFLYKEKMLGMERKDHELQFFSHGNPFFTLPLQENSNGILRINIPDKLPDFLTVDDLIQLVFVEFLPQEQIKHYLFLFDHQMIRKENLDQLHSLQQMQIPIKTQDFHHFSRSPYVQQ